MTMREFREHVVAYPQESDFYRIAQADPLGFDIHLNAAGGARAGIRIHPWHHRANIQDGVTAMHRLFGRRGPEVPDAAGRER